MSWISHLYGTLSQLLIEDYWQSAVAEDAVQEIEKLFEALSEVGTLGADIPVGTIVAFPTLQTPPVEWLVCDGSTYAEADYPELALVLNGISGVGGFDLPNLRGHTIVGQIPISLPIGSAGGLAFGSDLSYTVMTWWIKAK
jgi:hypothetical protein